MSVSGNTEVKAKVSKVQRWKTLYTAKNKQVKREFKITALQGNSVIWLTAWYPALRKQPPNQNSAPEEDAQTPLSVLRDRKKLKEKKYLTCWFVFFPQGVPAASLPCTAARHKGSGTARCKLQFLRTQSQAVNSLCFQTYQHIFQPALQETCPMA